MPMQDDFATDTRRGAEDKAEPGAAKKAHEHKFTTIIDNPDDPPAREVCEVCAVARPLGQDDVKREEPVPMAKPSPAHQAHLDRVKAAKAEDDGSKAATTPARVAAGKPSV